MATPIPDLINSRAYISAGTYIVKPNEPHLPMFQANMTAANTEQSLDPNSYSNTYNNDHLLFVVCQAVKDLIGVNASLEKRIKDLEKKLDGFENI